MQVARKQERCPKVQEVLHQRRLVESPDGSMEKAVQPSYGRRFQRLLDRVGNGLQRQTCGCQLSRVNLVDAQREISGRLDRKVVALQQLDSFTTRVEQRLPKNSWRLQWRTCWPFSRNPTWPLSIRFTSSKKRMRTTPSNATSFLST